MRYDLILSALCLPLAVATSKWHSGKDMSKTHDGKATHDTMLELEYDIRDFKNDVIKSGVLQDPKFEEFWEEKWTIVDGLRHTEKLLSKLNGEDQLYFPHPKPSRWEQVYPQVTIKTAQKHLKWAKEEFQHMHKILAQQTQERVQGHNPDDLEQRRKELYADAKSLKDYIDALYEDITRVEKSMADRGVDLNNPDRQETRRVGRPAAATKDTLFAAEYILRPWEHGETRPLHSLLKHVNDGGRRLQVARTLHDDFAETKATLPPHIAEQFGGSHPPADHSKS